MSVVFVLVALLFWLTVVAVVAFARLSRSTFRWTAALGHGPRSANIGPGNPPLTAHSADSADDGFTA